MTELRAKVQDVLLYLTMMTHLSSQTSLGSSHQRMVQASILIGTTFMLSFTACRSAPKTNADSRRDTKPAVVEPDALTTAPTAKYIKELEIARVPVAKITPFLSAEYAEPLRIAAADALARLERPESITALIDALDDPAAGVRIAVYFALGQIDLGLQENATDESIRSRIENVLIERLVSESHEDTKKAIIGALGRIGRRGGFDNLLVVARTPGALQVPALMAIGVNGARTEASHSQSPALKALLVKTLSSDDESVRRAAAYALFRQKVKVTAKTLTQAANGDLQTRIHLARATAFLDDNEAALFFLQDADWRVQSESLHALKRLAKTGAPPGIRPLQRALQSALTHEKGEKKPTGFGHIVNESCRLFAEPTVGLNAKKARAILKSSTKELGDIKHSSACDCAIAHDALLGKISLLGEQQVQQACTNSSANKDETMALAALEVYEQAATSSKMRALEIEPFFKNKSARVRVAAAGILSQGNDVTSRSILVEKLGKEKDPIVAATLLNAVDVPKEELSSVKLAKLMMGLVKRFEAEAKDDPEAEEALLAIAHKIVPHDSVSFGPLKKRLGTLKLPRVNDVLEKRSRLKRGAAKLKAFKLLPDIEMPFGVRVETTKGSFRMAFSKDAPITVQNFVSLARDGFYDGLPFHRVIPAFVAQGGDPHGHGSGGPGHHIPCENNARDYIRGSVGMALDGKDTGGSQFFVSHTDQPHLKGRYTLFAHVTDGLEVVDALTQRDRIITLDFMTGVAPK